MNADTTIAKNIRVADEKAGYDAACKRLLSEKIILAWIMKNCLEEYQNCDVNEIAEEYIEGTPQVGEMAVAPDETNQAPMIHGTEFIDSYYEKIKKVYSIWICMNPPKNRKNSITRYYISEENLVGGVKERKADYDLMAAVMICLGEEDSDTDILKLLNILFSRRQDQRINAR